MRVLLCRIVGVVSVALLLPNLAYAQASIAGVVRDSSGAVIPGVTVEAASPALIEKVRTAVTDGSGQYRITELRPGTYTVTFTLAGFNTVRREGIELEGTFVATVNADLRVGALEETITVTGAASVVDTQSAKQQQVLSRDTVRDLPTSRQFFGLVTLIPGMTVSQRDVGGTNMTQAGNYTIHGGRSGDGRVSVDGVTVGQRGSGNSDGGGTNMTMYTLNAGLMQETAITTSGGLGEAETGGVSVNMIPREGGNTLRGSFFGTYGNNALQADNYDDHLRSLGLRSANEVKSIWEWSGQVGGPVVKDRVWYVFSGKYTGTRNWIAGMYANKNAGDVTKWTYEPDLTERAFSDDTIRSAALRLTFQASSKNKINVFWDEQWRGTDVLGGGAATRSPEAAHRMYSVALSCLQYDVEQSVHQPPVVRGGLRRDVPAVGWQDERSIPSPRLDPGHRTGGNDPGPDLPEHELEQQFPLSDTTPRVGLVCDRFPLRQVRRDAHVEHLRRPFHESQPDRVPVQQRRAQSVDAVRLAAIPPVQHLHGWNLRAGFVGHRPLDAPGRRSLRHQPLLLQGAVRRVHPVRPQRVRHSEDRRGRCEGHHAADGGFV